MGPFYCQRGYYCHIEIHGQLVLSGKMLCHVSVHGPLMLSGKMLLPHRDTWATSAVRKLFYHIGIHGPLLLLERILVP